MIEYTMIKKHFSHLNKSFLFCALLVFSATLAMLVVTNSMVTTTELQHTYYAASVDMVDQRMNSLFYEINNFPRYPGNDILFLANLSDTKNNNIKTLENDFLTFIKENTAYAKISYMATDGQTLAAVGFNGKDYQIIPPEKELNDKQADWFGKIISLNKGDVYISHLNRDSVSNNVMPIIKYGTPVYTDDGILSGLIICSVNANYFLEDIRQSQRKGEEVFLIDNTGQYLAHPDKTKEFSLGSKNGANFKNDYPAAFEQIAGGSDKRVLEVGDRIFSFRYVYPTASSFAIYKGAGKITNPASKDYFWVMLSIVNKHDMEKQTAEASKQNILFLIFSGVTLVIVYILVFLLVFKAEEKSRI